MTADHSPLYPRNIPAAADFEARARSVGVNNDSHLVLYDQCPSGNGFFIGGRAWWTFKVSAHPRSNTQIIPRGGGGGGDGFPGAAIKPAWLESRRSLVRTSLWPSKFKRNKKILPRSLAKIQYCGEHTWPRGSVLGLRPPRLEFRILRLEDSVISIISPPSGGSPGPV